MRNPHRGLQIVVLVGLAMSTGCEAGREAGNAPRTRGSLSEHDAVRADLLFVRGYVRGYEQARREEKPMLVLFTVQGCGYCEQMIREASADEQVVRLSKRFVCILVDADLEPEICRDFRVRGYPTVQFISPRGVPLNRMMGKTPAQQLAVEMQAALEATATRVRYIRETTLR